MSTNGHLAWRFFGSIVPRRVSPSDRVWVGEMLSSQELQLWSKLHRTDAAESIGVARRVAKFVDLDDADRSDIIAAALLHDVGKLDSELGTYGRVVATVAAKLAGRSMVEAWVHSTGFTRRCGLYLQHAQLGGVRIRVAGGREVAAAWAVAHHDPRLWPDVALTTQQCRWLAEADGERVL